MTKKLGQVLAMVTDQTTLSKRRLNEAHHALQRSAMLEGIQKDYEPRFEDGLQLPSEGTRVQATVQEMIDATREALVDLFDIVAARDFTNGPRDGVGPVADVVVDGTTLVTQAPVPYLLWLEKQVIDLLTFAQKLPTLDAAVEWSAPDPRGVFKSPVVDTHRTEKRPAKLELFAPTDKQPGQAHVYEETQVVGTWHQVKFSGHTTPRIKADLVDRLEKLKAALHGAREEANRVDAIEPEPGHALVDYIFGPRS